MRGFLVVLAGGLDCKGTAFKGSSGGGGAEGLESAVVSRSSEARLRLRVPPLVSSSSEGVIAADGAETSASSSSDAIPSSGNGGNLAKCS